MLIARPWLEVGAWENGIVDFSHEKTLEREPIVRVLYVIMYRYESDFFVA